MMPIGLAMVFIRIAFFLLFFIFTSVGLSFAQTTIPSVVLESEEPIGTDPATLITPVEGPSEYALPYPGMLPNNPLYFLKNFRDSFIGFIISDPLKKAEFEVLQADKKLAAAQFLLKESGNDKKALASVEESAAHFKTAFAKLTATDTKSTDSQAVFQKMDASLQKHQEILTDLSESTRNDVFSSHAIELSKLQKKVESYL